MEAGRSGDQVIRRKVMIPPLPEHLVVRDRVTDLLAELLDRRQVVRLCATAGAGKTTAVADATRRLGVPVAWLSLDTSDTAPGRLLTYLEAALGQVDPSIAGFVTTTLNSGIPHVETAGLLSEKAGGNPVALVLDDLERLGEDPAPWAVIEALIRYAPPAMRILLLSRRDIPAVCPLPPSRGVEVLGESELAFTEAEAATALDRLRADGIDPATAVEATGGWVTGVLFEAWRADQHVRGAGGEADPLHGYLSSHILTQLTPEQREFLTVTSILDEVTAERAEALDLTDAGLILGSLAAAHLPVSWTPDRRAMRCHPRFREYLGTLLASRGRAQLRRLRLLHGHRLAVEGHYEEATERFLDADAPAEAIGTAERAIFEVIDRLDFPIAARWFAALEPECPPGANTLTTARLMMAVVQDDYAHAVQLADHLAQIGQREALAARSAQAAALLGWCYNHVARLDDVRAVLDAAPPGPEIDTVSYCASLLIDFPDRPRPKPPAPTGGPLDAIPFAASYYLGQLTDPVDLPASPWAETLSQPYRIAMLRARGQTQEALRLYQAAQTSTRGTGPLHSAIGPELLIDTGQLDDAAAEIERGRRLAQASGSLAFQALNIVVAMKLAVRREGDPAKTLRALQRLDRASPVRRFQFTAELRDMWFGLTLLKLDSDAEALVRLRRAAHGMVAGSRTLDLPAAAVYLAEAEWRAGNEDAADQAARLALHTAEGQASNYLLLQALRDFPTVLSRQLDAQPDADSDWHELGRALLVRTSISTPTTTDAPRAHLVDFGTPALRVDGEPVNPGLARCYELLAYMCAHGPSTDRAALLHALFDGADTQSTRANLRQILRRLNAVLPDQTRLDVTTTQITLGDPVGCASLAFEHDVSASGTQGKARLDALLKALARYDEGRFLAETGSAWAEQRRTTLDKLAVDARYEAAELAYTLGRLHHARELVRHTLEEDPYREPAWRLTMRIADALGDEAGLITAYRDCERALRELSMSPSPTTTKLFVGMRR